jgi:hypothetical protein
MVSFFFHAKGRQEVNWRHVSQKRSKEMEISLRHNRALNVNTFEFIPLNPSAAHVGLTTQKRQTSLRKALQS